MTIYLFSFLTSLGEYSYFVPLPELLIWPLGGLCHGSSVSTGPVANQNLKHFREKLITSYLFPVLIIYVCVCVCLHVHVPLPHSPPLPIMQAPQQLHFLVQK